MLLVFVISSPSHPSPALHSTNTILDCYFGFQNFDNDLPLCISVLLPLLCNQFAKRLAFYTPPPLPCREQVSPLILYHDRNNLHYDSNSSHTSSSYCNQMVRCQYMSPINSTPHYMFRILLLFTLTSSSVTSSI